MLGDGSSSVRGSEGLKLRLAQFRTSNGIRVGKVIGESVIDVQQSAIAVGRTSEAFGSIRGLLESGDNAISFVRTLVAGKFTIPLNQVELAAPVFPKKIVAIGLNYLDHAHEAGMEIPKTPLCFAKFTSSLSGPFDPILLPAEDAQVDYEGELGVVIGQRAHRVTEADAMKHVAGYVAFNDVSARKWQFEDGQWIRGKSCDSFAPNGPWIVTAEEIPDPGSLRITTRVNGEVLQDSNTKQLIFSVAKLVSYFSHSFTLEPGDIFATGTPPGVGVARKPPRFLQDGDVVEVEIENIGTIRNRVVRAYSLEER
jgi:2-keto-4-pentenoate hydratase/2-oxohepta-3-ene-1,7-dioic acid hydratase in catechol pathway